VEAWVIWLIVAVVLGLLEVTTLTLVLGFFAGGALAAALVAAFGGGLGFQVVSFLVVSLALLGLLRPVVRRHMKPELGIRTGVSALVGQTAVALERVDAHRGQVKLAGEIWTARAYDPAVVIEAGSPVSVIEIKGATALVYPSEEPWTISD
jgi:membrane protein implicated in regulation of membrane protease activity